MNFSADNRISRETQAVPVYDWTPLEKERLLADSSKELLWKKYCGFLDLSLKEYLAIQKQLMKEQIQLATQSFIGRRIFGLHKPDTVAEFRHLTDFTDYAFYHSFFKEQPRAAFVEPVLYWTEVPRPGGEVKYIPLSLSFITALADDAISALVLSAASCRGEVKLGNQNRVLTLLQNNVISGALNTALRQRLDCVNLIENNSFLSAEKGDCLSGSVKKGLRDGLDYVISTPQKVTDIGENIGSMTDSRYGEQELSLLARLRLLRAAIIKKFRGGFNSAGDYWKPRGIVCCGEYFVENKDRISAAWGVKPLEVFCAPEAGFMAMQHWTHQYLTFIPYRNFYEFIPQQEYLKAEEEESYRPKTVLMDEVKTGELYELVISNLHGGPFIRYRTGHILRVMAAGDPASNIHLPQFSVYSRAA
jgi:hypothetical protein